MGTCIGACVHIGILAHMPVWCARVRVRVCLHTYELTQFTRTNVYVRPCGVNSGTTSCLYAGLLVCVCECVLFLYIIMGVHVHIGVCLGIDTRQLTILMLNL